MASNPIVMVASQPTLGVVCLKVLIDMVLIGGEDPSSGILEVCLEDAKTRSMAWRVPQNNSLSEFEKIAVKRSPV